MGRLVQYKSQCMLAYVLLKTDRAEYVIAVHKHDHDGNEKDDDHYACLIVVHSAKTHVLGPVALRDKCREGGVHATSDSNTAYCHKPNQGIYQRHKK